MEKILLQTFRKYVLETKSDLDMALTACYGTMTKSEQGYFSWGTPKWDSFVDNCRSVDEGITFDVFQGNIDPSTTGIIQDVYIGSYTGITRMNLFLYQLGKYTNTDLSESERNFYEGQVLFYVLSIIRICTDVMATFRLF